MKQPEIGIRITETRNQRGITQKELSESSHIDIRTIQRIEAGEVTPRVSTLRLIDKVLSAGESIFNGDVQEQMHDLTHRLLFVFLITGIVYFISAVLLSPIIPFSSFLYAIYPIRAFLYIITGVLFYYGFYLIGKSGRNSFLRIASVLFMVLIPLFLFTIMVLSKFSFAKNINQLIIVLLGLNGIFFGMGLIKMKDRFMYLFTITGIVLIIGAPFIIIPVPVINYIGWWLSLLSIILQIAIVFMEYRNSKEQKMPVACEE